jgi:DNA-binding beta-propeller fold protein YncE
MKPFRLSGLILFIFVTFSFPENPAQSAAPPGMIFELLALNKDIPTVARPKYLSPSAMVASPDSHYLYIAEQTAKQIGVVDIMSQSLKSNIKLPSEPTGIAISADGSKLYATCSSDLWPQGMVCEIDVSTEKVVRRIPAGFGARSPVITHSGKTLFVCNQFENSVSSINIASGKEDIKIPSFRQPYAAAITPDDSVLIIANLLPTEISTDTLKISSKILLVDAFAGKVRDTLLLPLGSHSILGVAVSPDGKFAYATHRIANFRFPATKIEGGWIHSNHVAIIDIKNRNILNDVCLDMPASGDADPWDVKVTADGKILVITHAGSGELSVLDVHKLDSLARAYPYVTGVYTDTAAHPVSLPRNLTLLTEDIRERVQIQSQGARSLSVIGNKAYTAGYFGDFIEIFDIAVGATKPSGIITLGPSQPMTSERKGEQAIFNANICFQKWQSCHTCHPFGRADGLNWTLKSELNAPKNTKSLVLAWWTPPTYWSGSPRGVGGSTGSIRMSMINELFQEPDWDIAFCLDTFFMKMKPTPSPFLVKGKLSAAASKGRDLFLKNKDLDCVDCHPSPLYCDKKFHVSEIDDPYDANSNWDTPSLIEAWRTGPYNHLGAESTIMDHMKNTKHSNASKKLNLEQMDQLMEFVSSL